MKHLNTWLQFFMLYIFVELFKASVVNGLRLIELRVPSHAALGTRANLSCSWALSAADSLYSVKWYKDGSEFYRHVPSARPHHNTQFALPGVNVDAARASGGNVTLSPLTLQSAGRYRCEVSGEAPLFLTVSDHADMIVVAVPDEGPSITGIRPRYEIGDRVHVTCTSGRSKPAARLAWFINDEPVPATSVGPPEVAAEAAMPSNRDGLESTSIVLDFEVKAKHFKKVDLKLKCLATIAALYWRSSEESVQGDRKRKGYSDTQTREVSLENPRARAHRVLQQAAVAVGRQAYNFPHSSHSSAPAAALAYRNLALACVTYYFAVRR